MTTELTVLTAPDEGAYRVNWACGVRSQGVLYLHMPAQLEDADIAAELFALQHLLEKREVCGHDRAGNGLTITCSFGAIKKLHHLQSKKAHLHDWAHFLTIRFSEAAMRVDKSDAFIRPRARDDVETLIVEAPLPETLELHGVGTVVISKHVFSRFLERMGNSLSPAHAWRRLCGWAAESCVVPYQLPPSISQAKEAKHGSVGQHFVNPRQKCQFVVVPGERGLTLATINFRGIV